MLLMFLIPIKIKWLAYLDIALFVYEMVIGNIGTKISIAMALLNFVIFFFGFMRKRVSPAQMHRRAAYKKAVKKMPSRHRCAVCGSTEETNPERIWNSVIVRNVPAIMNIVRTIFLPIPMSSRGGALQL